MLKETKAQTFAIEKHGAQMYGDKPYSAHLSDVVEVLKYFGHDDLIVAGWLHDVLEDTNTTYQEVSDQFGQKNADLVFAVTGIGKNRKERNASAYAKIKALPKAATLKLADRIANVESSLKSNQSLFQMYYKEWPQFKEELKDLGDPEMWDHLEKLMENGSH